MVPKACDQGTDTRFFFTRLELTEIDLNLNLNVKTFFGLSLEWGKPPSFLELMKYCMLLYDVFKMTVGNSFHFLP